MTLYQGLTYDAYRGALKTANNEFNYACRKELAGDMIRWKKERDRILAILTNWTELTGDSHEH